MARLTRPSRPQNKSESQSQLDRINAAFDQAILGPQSHSRVKKKRRVISDDEEDDDDAFELVAGDGGGGFIPHADQSGGGGFIPDDTDTGGGFIDEENEMGGGFIPDEDESAAGGGFIIDPPSDSGGGYLPEDSIPSSSTHGIPPEFIPYDPANSIPVPVPSPTTTIPLSQIPFALSLLSLPSTSHDLLSLFRDAAVEEEVSRERFERVCLALMEESGSESGSGSGSESESEGYTEEVDVGRRRSTRASARERKGKEKASDQDVEMDLTLPSSSSSTASASDFENPPKSKPTKPTKRPKSTKPRPKRTTDPLSPQDLVEARDSFNLFFDGAPSIRGEKTIGLTELRRVCALLGEGLSDAEMMEMLEYAARDKGKVDLEGFARVMQEAL